MSSSTGTPISEAADHYRADSAKYLARYRDLLKAVEPSLTPGKIDAPELGYTFGHAHGGMGKVDWQFVDGEDVPAGPWADVVTGADKPKHE